jgi:DNA-binding IclR family transcriptional regulator
MVAADAVLTDWVQLVRAEYMEMPGLTLTCLQIQRMWGIDRDTCHEIVSTLTASGFLSRRPDGSYSRSRD